MNLGPILAFSSAGASSLLAAIALLRRPRSLAQWAFFSGVTFFAAESFFSGLILLSAATPVRMLLWHNLRVLSVAALPAPWLIFTATYSRGDSDRILKKWLLPIIIFGALLLGGVCIGWDQILERLQVGEDQPIWFAKLGPSGIVIYVGLLVTSILVLLNIEWTFRATVGTTRWRLKFMVLGVVLLFGVRFYSCTQTLLFGGITPALLIVNAIALLIASVLIAIGLLRMALSRMDVYPSRVLISNSLTVLLAGIYLLVVGVFAKLVITFGGEAAFSLKAFLVLVAIVVLAVLLLSERLRERIKRFVSRHFDRPHYDYKRVWSTFTERTTSLMDAASLSRAITQWLSQTFNALSVTMWIRDSAREQLIFASSTSLSDPEEKKPVSIDTQTAELLATLSKNPSPVDLEAANEDRVAAIKQSHPDVFRSGGNRLLVPAVVNGQLLGLLVLGDRVNGVPFSMEEIELLRCVGDQVAGNLLNLQLSRKLLENKEMEAFQTMSAFFVHDLKNTASTLSLMLQNLPDHFDDPEFRRDSLRGLAKSVERINELIQRLTLLRQELQLKPMEVDLNSLVTNVLSNMSALPQSSLKRNLQHLPKMSLDADKIQKVLTNLLMNAAEAVGEKGGGEIQVETSRRNGWAVLTVADTGRGMNPEFMRNSLFRPFQTTKKKGIGIGMFLSKIIVEAHSGKIEVESEPGKGTTFRVLLPMASESP